ncbi:MAG: hypothetical protein M3R46_01035 [Actinomycetota bacterium]|nr:hypothetical protein [Actinomycetota bacterium]
MGSRATPHRLPAGLSDFRAHLLGRIAWIESLHPARGARLRSQFTRIVWDRQGAA